VDEAVEEGHFCFLVGKVGSSLEFHHVPRGNAKKSREWKEKAEGGEKAISTFFACLIFMSYRDLLAQRQVEPLWLWNSLRTRRLGEWYSNSAQEFIYKIIYL
jgi:hypothetical protein